MLIGDWRVLLLCWLVMCNILTSHQSTDPLPFALSLSLSLSLMLSLPAQLHQVTQTYSIRDRKLRDPTFKIKLTFTRRLNEKNVAAHFRHCVHMRYIFDAISIIKYEWNNFLPLKTYIHLISILM